jgi:cell division septum initiation protein DivIVA
MRTTIELTERQHRALSGLAQRRKIRGFSQLVQEAVDAYLNDVDADEVEVLLSLEGSLSEEEEHELSARIKQLRAVWRAP